MFSKMITESIFFKLDPEYWVQNYRITEAQLKFLSSGPDDLLWESGLTGYLWFVEFSGGNNQVKKKNKKMLWGCGDFSPKQQRL